MVWGRTGELSKKVGKMKVTKKKNRKLGIKQLILFVVDPTGQTSAANKNLS